MIRRNMINVLQAVINRLEDSLKEEPTGRPFKLMHEDMDVIRAFLASPKLTHTDH